MKPREVIRIAWEAIVKNTVRSILTMLGIIIGVAAVIIMIAISAGTEASIQDQITSLGSNLVFVQSSFTRGGPGQGGPSGGLVFDDATAIAEAVNGVKAVVVEQGSCQSDPTHQLRCRQLPKTRLSSRPEQQHPPCRQSSR